MNVEVYSKKELGEKAALRAAEKIKKSIQENGTANIILATGASQFETSKNLILLLNWMRRAASSKWEKAGSKRWKMYPKKQLVCPFDK